MTDNEAVNKDSDITILWFFLMKYWRLIILGAVAAPIVVIVNAYVRSTGVKPESWRFQLKSVETLFQNSREPVVNDFVDFVSGPHGSNAFLLGVQKVATSHHAPVGSGKPGLIFFGRVTPEDPITLDMVVPLEANQEWVYEAAQSGVSMVVDSYNETIVKPYFENLQEVNAVQRRLSDFGLRLSSQFPATTQSSFDNRGKDVLEELSNKLSLLPANHPHRDEIEKEFQSLATSWRYVNDKATYQSRAGQKPLLPWSAMEIVPGSLKVKTDGVDIGAPKTSKLLLWGVIIGVFMGVGLAAFKEIIINPFLKMRQINQAR